MDTAMIGTAGTAVPTRTHGHLPAPAQPTLSRAALRAGIDRHRETLAGLEAALAADCEAAAARGRSRHVDMQDRETWDQVTWDRYIDAAKRFEPDYGPRMRKLLNDIDRLTRLYDLAVRP